MKKNPFHMTRRIAIAFAVLLPLTDAARACITCAGGPEGEAVNGTRDAIFGAGFLPGLGLTLLPFGVLTLMMAGMWFLIAETERGPVREPLPSAPGAPREVGP